MEPEWLIRQGRRFAVALWGVVVDDEELLEEEGEGLRLRICDGIFGLVWGF